MKQIAIKTFKSKYFLIPVFLLSIIVVSIIVHFSNIKDLSIFPDTKNFEVGYYTDKPNGGNSKVLDFIQSDSAIKFSYHLNNKFHSPYVGISITPKNEKYINAKKYNNISISILGKNTERIGLSIFTTPFYSNDKDESLFHYYLNISENKEKYKIPISAFEHPDWWEDLHQLSENYKDKPDMNNILHINIGSAFSPNIDNLKSIEINNISFIRDNTKLFMSIGLSYFTLVLLYYYIVYIVFSRKIKNAKITITYKSLENIEDVSYEERCIKYINSNYDKNNLSLEKVSKATAITQRRITRIIRDKFECNFKTYLNRIRINESKKLLSQSGLTIGEIAFKVGFNNQSHFNRVFKSELNFSPTTYRDKSKL